MPPPRGRAVWRTRGNKKHKAPSTRPVLVAGTTSWNRSEHTRIELVSLEAPEPDALIIVSVAVASCYVHLSAFYLPTPAGLPSLNSP